MENFVIPAYAGIEPHKNEHLDKESERMEGHVPENKSGGKSTFASDNFTRSGAGVAQAEQDGGGNFAIFVT